METTSPYRVVVLTLLGVISPLSAQNLSESTFVTEIRPLAVSDLEGRDFKRFDGAVLPGTYEVPATKAKADVSQHGGITLGNGIQSDADVESVVDLSTLREPSPFRKVAVAAGTSSSEAAAKNLPVGLALLSATYRDPNEKAKEADCSSLGLSVQQRVKLTPANVLEIVEAEITANASCACEIVKAALTTMKADPALTGQIVEVAATAAPESMRLISQCAIATVPEALGEVQAVLAKLDPNSGDGESSSKSSKSAKSSKSKEIIPPKVEWPDPLDLPPLGPPLPPPPYNPPPTTEVDSRKADECEPPPPCDPPAKKYHWKNS